MTNKEFERQKRNIEQVNLEKQQRRELRKLKHPKMIEFKKPSWSKFMMVIIVAICIEIVVYSEIVMWCHYDLSALYALIAVPAALFGTFWSYSTTVRVDHAAGGITYEMAMLDKKKETISDEDKINEGTDGGENSCG